MATKVLVLAGGDSPEREISLLSGEAVARALNEAGYEVTQADPADGLLDVAVAIPVVTRRMLRGPAGRVEVRRTRGRAVSITPLDGDLPYLDDGVAAQLGRTRSWWIESGAWAVYVP